jgi:hypothetical protein
MTRTILIALLLASPLYAQYPGIIYTPEIHLGSATEPSTITVPPIEFVPDARPEPEVSSATPADTELLAQRHWDFVVSPMEGVGFCPQGSMADTSISLGKYARQLRDQKHKAVSPTAPNGISWPTCSR